MDGNRLSRRVWAVAAGAAVVVLSAPVLAAADDGDQPGRKRYRGLLGADSKKVKTVGDKTYLWASGDPASADSQWYDFTGSAIPAAELQFGIGKDRIAAIDDPLFVPPDDPRLLELPPPAYGRGEKPESNDDIMVIGYVEKDQARAYPTALLDRHELVNDRIAGRPVAVGW